MKKKHILFSTIISMGMMVSSCSDYLSVEGKLGENTQSLENIFENRYKYTQELIRMGAKISIEGKTAVIKGVRKLYGANVNATDLRGGAALVLAATVAKGTTKIENIEYILRGYESLDKKLMKLGVNIQTKL